MSEFNNMYASRGQGNAGVALGVVGTALGGLAALGNGILNGGNCNRAGWGNGECSDNTPVTRYELQQEKEITAVKTENALLRANTYQDQKSIEMFKYVDGKLEEIREALSAQAVFNQKAAGDIQLVRKDLEMETKCRCCADNSIVAYANSTFYAKLIAGITASTADATPQSTYNPIPSCNPCCNGN